MGRSSRKDGRHDFTASQEDVATTTLHGGISLLHLPREKRDYIERLIGRPEDYRDYKPKSRDIWISLDAINILPQPRKTFSGIRRLAENIAQIGQLQNPVLAMFDRRSCESYLATIEVLWNVRRRIRSLHPTVLPGGKQVYYVLLSGERRTRAWRYLRRYGCKSCRVKYGQEPSGTCLQRHRELTRDGRVKVQIRPNIPLAIAFGIQIAENGYVNLPPDEEAWSLYLNFSLLKATSPQMTAYEFAQRVNRGVYAVRRAIRYCEQVPDFVQESVKEGKLQYGHAIEIGRFIQATRKNGEFITEDELRAWVGTIENEQTSVPALRRQVSGLLVKRRSQPSLGDMFGGSVLDHLIKPPKLVAGRQMLPVLYERARYFRTIILEKLSKGEIGLEDSPFSIRSFLRLYRIHVDEVEKVNRHLRNLLKNPKAAKGLPGAGELDHHRQVLADNTRLTSQLLPLANDEDLGLLIGGSDDG